MASYRQKKKQEKKQLVKKVAAIQKKEPKAVEKLNYNQLKDIVTQNEKRERKNARERQRRAENRKLIDKYGLKGFKPSDSSEKIKAAAQKAQEEIERQQRREIKERNREILEASGIPKEKWPSGWTKMGEPDLLEKIEKIKKKQEHDPSKMIQSDVYLYIGWGDRSWNEHAMNMFGADGYYAGIPLNDLRGNIVNTVNDIGETTSSGRAGDTVIEFGSYATVYKYMKSMEQLGYQTVFFGNEISHRALMRYTAACVDSSPESNRPWIVSEINGYLEDAGRPELTLKGIKRKSGK